jgi:phosphoglycolate phosphatase-like HAD superfamily hydrolase
MELVRASLLPVFIRLVAFDLDDTLVETRPNILAQHKHVALVSFGRELSDEYLLEHWGKPFPVMAEAYYGTCDLELIRSCIKPVKHRFPKILYPYSIPKLIELHDAGILVGIVTANSRHGYEYDMDFHGFPREVISFHQAADDSEHHKPDGRVFDILLRWAAERGIARHEILYVGDGLHDMSAALEAGISFLGVETGLVTAAEFKLHSVLSVPHVGYIQTAAR